MCTAALSNWKHFLLLFINFPCFSKYHLTTIYKYDTFIICCLKIIIYQHSQWIMRTSRVHSIFRLIKRTYKSYMVMLKRSSPSLVQAKCDYRIRLDFYTLLLVTPPEYIIHILQIIHAKYHVMVKIVKCQMSYTIQNNWKSNILYIGS